MSEYGEDEQEAAYDDFVDDLREQFRDEALEDEELYERVVKDFATVRLRAYYEGHPDVLSPCHSILDEARRLLPHSHRAGLVFAVSASEICLNNVLLRPIVHGLVHSEGTADVIAEVAVAPGSGRFTESLLRVIAVHGGVDLMKYQAPGRTPLWIEIKEAKKHRNTVVHQGGEASREWAESATSVADTLLTVVVPKVIDTIGLHLHPDHRVCGLSCSQPSLFS